MHVPLVEFYVHISQVYLQHCFISRESHCDIAQCLKLQQGNALSLQWWLGQDLPTHLSLSAYDGPLLLWNVIVRMC